MNDNNEELQGETLEIEQMFAVVKGTNAKLQIDGDQYCYIAGIIPECYIAGFGDTPRDALFAFFKDWKESKPPMVKEYPHD